MSVHWPGKCSGWPAHAGQKTPMNAQSRGGLQPRQPGEGGPGNWENKSVVRRFDGRTVDVGELSAADAFLEMETHVFNGEPGANCRKPS